MFSAMVIDTFQDCSVGVGIYFCMDGKLFNLRRFHAKTHDVPVRDLLFTGDCALIASTEAEMQHRVGLLSKT